MTVAAIVIGRNEGDRLVRCLASLKGKVNATVYVDSGSSDGSVAAATAAGAHVISLNMTVPFTAARARNAGLSYLRQTTVPEFVQVIDGDCELRDTWIDQAQSFLVDHPDVAIVAGRLRERFPNATIWNHLADAEWDTAVGKTDAVGGIAMLRLSAITDVGGYRDSLIAGEEPELCLRLIRAGWHIWRLEVEMAWHDIGMTRFSQWWRRARRHGHALAEGARLHGKGPENYCVAQMRRALIWGAGIPFAGVLGMVVSPWSFLLLLAWPAQVLRLRARGETWLQAFFLMLSKLPEAQGILRSYWDRLTGEQAKIIEYKF